MRNQFRKTVSFLLSHDARTAVEYAAILALIVGVAIVAADCFGIGVQASFTSAARSMTSGPVVVHEVAGGRATAFQTTKSVGLKPLTEMLANDSYKGEPGGLYGGGKNCPPEALESAAESRTAQIQPLDADGNPAADGKIALISIGMSNAMQEFCRFKQLANLDAEKSPRVVIVDCAESGEGMTQWADASARLWGDAQRRLEMAKVTPKQVQIAWMKLANAGPSGELEEHGMKLKQDTIAALRVAQSRLPNLQLAYLSSRIYGGYARDRLNPEPFAYEGAFVVRWLIQDQLNNQATSSSGNSGGACRCPLLLWGPYLWADGIKPRSRDALVWTRNDLAPDGTHPGHSGQEKVAHMLLDFFKTDSNTRTWFVKPSETFSAGQPTASLPRMGQTLPCQ